MVKNALVAAVFLVGGFALSSWWTSRASHPARDVPVLAVGTPSAPAGGVDLVAMRAMIREEIQQARAPAPPTGDRAADDVAADPQEMPGDPAAPVSPRGRKAPPTPEQAAAHSAASTLVEAGIAAGRWTTQDEEQWQELADKLAPGAGQDVRGRLFEAINEGHVFGDVRFGRRVGMPHPVAVRTP
jgi:hypothetical protein